MNQCKPHYQQTDGTQATAPLSSVKEMMIDKEKMIDDMHAKVNGKKVKTRSSNSQYREVDGLER